MLVGAANTPDFPNGDTRTDEQSWNDLDVAVGPLHIRRSYEGALPATFADSPAGFDVGTGRASWLSFKYDPTGATAGTHDAAITAFVQSIPDGHETYLTYYHEPEDNMTFSEFVSAFRHVYNVIKAVGKPLVKVGSILTEWTWDSRSGRNPDDWDVGSDKADFYGVDSYNPYTPASLPPNDPNQVNNTWLDLPPQLEVVADWCSVRGRPPMLGETGCHEDDTGIGPQRKIDWIERSVNRAAQLGYEGFCWFDSYVGGRGPWWLRTSTGSTDMYATMVQLQSTSDEHIFRGVNGQYSDFGTTVSTDLPAGVQTGDLLLSWVALTSLLPTLTQGPAGWTQVDFQIARNLRVAFYRKVATDSDLGVPVSATQSDSGKMSILVAAVGNGVFDTYGVNVETEVFTTDHTLPIVAADGNEIAVAVATERAGQASTWTVPSPWAEQLDLSGSGGGTSNSVLATQDVTISGNVGGEVFTSTSSERAAIMWVVLSREDTTQVVSPATIFSASAVGTATLAAEITVSPTGVLSSVALGTPSLSFQPPDQLLEVVGIASVRAVGQPTVSQGALVIISEVGGIASKAVVGIPGINDVSVSVTVFIPPTTREAPAGAGIFFERFSLIRGISVIKRLDGTFYQTRFPAQEELEAAELFYIGGHEYVVDEVAADELIAAGYGDNITVRPA